MLEKPTPEEKLVHPEVRYEKSDANIGAVLAFGAGLVVLGIIVHVAAGWLLASFKKSADRQYPPLPALAAKERPQLPQDLGKIPQPRLQQSQTVDLKELRHAEDAHLASYGWVDPKAGIVRIPITEAMRLLADPKTAEARGIRVQQPPPAYKGDKR
jgi:hypothetical protein